MGSSQQAVANELNQLQLERNVLLVEQEELGRKNNETAYSNVSLAEQELALRIQTNAKAIEDRERLLGIYEQEAQKLRDIEGSLQFSANYITLVAERALDAAEATDKIDFSKAISGAARLADELGISVSHASRIMALTGGRRGTILDPRDPNYDPIAAGMVGLREDYGKVSPFDPSRQPKVRESGGAARIKKETEAVKELTEAEKQRLNILKSVESSLESGFMSMVDGTKSVKSAFRSMAADIVKELYRVLVVQRLVGAISGGIGMFSGRSTGSLGLPFGLATGGSMMPGKSYLVGENGPELVIPRHSGTVVNANQTANAAGGSGGVTVQNNISVTGSDAAMVRAEVAKMIPQITNATKAAVIDARLRGGQMKAAFT
jgi:phage-related minor tail protein